MKRLTNSLIIALLMFASSALADNLKVNPVTASPGTTVEIPVELVNTKVYSMFEMNVVLPNDFELTGVTKSERFKNGRLYDFSKQSDGSYQIVTQSQEEVITGNSGTLLTLSVKVPTTAQGSYTGRIQNVLFTDMNITPAYFPDVSFTITVSKPSTITITAKSYSREYGDANPTFEYTVTGGTITGTPKLNCTATKTSDVGSYTITVEKGTVQGDVKLVNGTLTVTKAPLTVKANDCERYVGEDNPTFTLSYSGWKNGQGESVLTTKPTATCSATKNSPAGTYPIKVSGGSAKNYSFKYVEGTLMVIEASQQKDLVIRLDPDGSNLLQGTIVTIYVTDTSGNSVEGVTLNCIYDSFNKYNGWYGETAPFQVQIEDNCTLKVAAFKDGYNTAILEKKYTVFGGYRYVGQLNDWDITDMSHQFNMTGDGKTWELTMFTTEDDSFSIVPSDVFTWDDYLKIWHAPNTNLSGTAVTGGGDNFIVKSQAGMESYTIRIVPSTMHYEIVTNVKGVSQPTNQTVQLSSAGYATFYSSESAYTLPNGLSAQVVTSVANNKLTYKTIADGSVVGLVPKGTAVMLVGKPKNSGTFTLSPSTSTTTYSGTNLLRGSDESTFTTGDGYHYKLTYGPSTDSRLKDVFGWYWGSSDGGGFLIEGHRAWLVLPTSAATRSFSAEGVANGISDMVDDAAEERSYDMQGRKVSQPVRKGIYIVNGKKKIIK